MEYKHTPLSEFLICTCGFWLKYKIRFQQVFFHSYPRKLKKTRILDVFWGRITRENCRWKCCTVLWCENTALIRVSKSLSLYPSGSRSFYSSEARSKKYRVYHRFKVNFRSWMIISGSLLITCNEASRVKNCAKDLGWDSQNFLI